MGAAWSGSGEPPVTATIANAALNTAHTPTTAGRIALTRVATRPTTRCHGLATTANGTSERRRPLWWRRSTSEVTDRSAVRDAQDQSSATTTVTTGKAAAARDQCGEEREEGPGATGSADAGVGLARPALPGGLPVRRLVLGVTEPHQVGPTVPVPVVADAAPAVPVVVAVHRQRHRPTGRRSADRSDRGPVPLARWVAARAPAYGAGVR